ncbi:mycothiol system anti-sigma-R factor [Nocardioides sp.]|uniref:mycothiol system anti-sigma-R factor n=1 Tax=Nocardioides sp. TaxID=35761 RepID=UPI00286D910B|nr:mycothiol system anti-sigma-R factor [Nocardioides sp.]
MSQHSPDHDDCSDYLERIVFFLDNELDEADCSEVRVHLEECGPCLEKYDLQRTVKQIVARSCSESAPDGLRERVRIQIREVQIRISEG